MDYEKLCEMLDSDDEQERNEAELILLGRLLYFEGDWINMLINEINGKKLKKPFEVKISKQYIAENEELEIFGQGDTEEEAVEDIKLILWDIYEDLSTDDGFDNSDEYAKKFLAYF